VTSKLSKPPAISYDLFEPSSKSSTYKQRFPTIGFSKTSKEEEDFAIRFEPMILSFHQIVYEVWTFPKLTTSRFIKIQLRQLIEQKPKNLGPVF
jgi:hypothetical protein